MPSLEVLIFAPLIVAGAYVIFAVSGFGLGLITMPLLAHLFPLKFAIPMMVMLDFIGSISMGLKLRADIHTLELKLLLPFLIVGMGVGVFLLLALSQDILLAVLGVFILAYGVLYVSGKQPTLRVGRWAAGPAGVLAGTASAMFGVGGPVCVMYLGMRGATLEQIRATIPTIFIFTTIARMIFYFAAGLYTLTVLYTSLALLPAMMLGLWLGHRLHLNLSREQLVRILGALLVVSGGSLLFRAAGA